LVADGIIGGGFAENAYEGARIERERHEWIRGTSSAACALASSSSSSSACSLIYSCSSVPSSSAGGPYWFVLCCVLAGAGWGYFSAVSPYGRGGSRSSNPFAYDEFLIGIGGGLVAGLVLGGFLLLASRIHRTPDQWNAPSSLPDIGPRWSERSSGPEP